MKKEHTFLKRCLSILLSVSMIVGLIVVTEPEKAADVQAAESTNLVTNGGFATTDGWTNNSDSSNPVAVGEQENVVATELVDSITDGDFESGTCTTWGSVHNLALNVVEENGNKVLKVGDFAHGKVFHVLSNLIAGETYTISFKAKASANMTFHLFCGDTGVNLAEVAMERKSVTTEWNTYEVAYTVPADKQGQLVFQNVTGSGSAEFYLDDFSATQEKEKIVDKVNTVFEADFEADTDANKIQNSPGSWQISTEDKKSGEKSLKLGFTSAYSQFSIGTFEMKAGTTYTVSYDWKIQDLS